MSDKKTDTKQPQTTADQIKSIPTPELYKMYKMKLNDLMTLQKVIDFIDSELQTRLGKGE